MLFGKFISERTPMDDYRRMLSQVDYCIENVDYMDRLPYDNRKKLDKSPIYKIVFGAMKILLLISGLALPVAIIAFWASGNSSGNNTLRLLCMCSFIMVIGSFGLALLTGCVGGYMETHSEKKDRKTKYIQESKTWVLMNGYVAVADSPQGYGGQMTKRYIMDEDNIVEVPFSRMDIIDRVYSIYNNKGKVTADVNATEYYIKHPYENEYPGDNVSHYFHYYQKRVRRRIEWNEKMQGIDKLIKALNALKH
ncbi:MAG: hypothetical protein ACI4EX_06005 [Lachnospiraceae bacterium]